MRYLVTIRKDVEETNEDSALERAIREIVEESKLFFWNYYRNCGGF